jgi:HEPN domain-containing protein
MNSVAENYYKAAFERIKDANLLHDEERYPLAMYDSGLAVECLLRAFRVLRYPAFDARHDLWLLWRPKIATP